MAADHLNSHILGSEGPGPYDDTQIDLVKVMNRFQLDKEMAVDY